MPRMKAAKRSELESFWRAHLDGWRRSELNQREYCELHGLPLKRFGNWRAKFKHEDDVPHRKLLWRRGGGLKHMSEHMLKENPSAPSGYIPSARSGGPGKRRNFRAADKRRIVEESLFGRALIETCHSRLPIRFENLGLPRRTEFSGATGLDRCSPTVLNN